MTAAAAPARRRCAIYTRKSTSAGLEKDFNSLDAQRGACEAFIRSQPGWELNPEAYDDGGFTGANIDRPAFTRLLADVDELGTLGRGDSARELYYKTKRILEKYEPAPSDRQIWSLIRIFYKPRGRR